MPIYEYQCQDCGNCFEYLVIGKPDPECSDCHSKKVSRQMSTCGFFSKWYLISGGMAAGHYGFVAALLFSSLVNTVLFFRLFEIGYFEPFASGHAHEKQGHTDSRNHSSSIAEAPLDVLVPLVATAVLLIVLGIYSGEIVARVIQFAIPAVIG